MLQRDRLHPPPPAPRFQAHVRAHEQVISNEQWYGDGPPDLGKAFTAAKTAEPCSLVRQITRRAAKRAKNEGADELAEAHQGLFDRLEACRPKHRCGSLACPNCARAFQKAKAAAQQAVIADLAPARSKKQLVFVTVIPDRFMYQPDQLHRIDVKKANRWLKDRLKAISKRVMLGSADLGWESRRGDPYIQLHWHLTMWTSNPNGLKAKLALIFPPTKDYERPVDVKPAADLEFLGYMNKSVKWPDLLRRNRRSLPELLLVLDRTEPLDLMIMTGFRLIAQEGGLFLKLI
jgi:hypothetical protein